MAENSLNHLNYGHAGAAAFDLENQEWSFARSSATTTLKQIGAFHKGKATSNEVVPASIHFPSTAVSTRTTDANTHAKDLLHAYPELVPAAELLSELVVTSAAIVSTTATYDPLVGDLFSLGTATFEDLWANPRRICATVTGEAGNVLRLALLYKETQGWGSDKSVWLRGSTLRDTESGYWNEEAAPIQHVCFAESEDRSKFLAVRLPTRTVIFRPLYTQRPQPSYSPHYEFPPSLVDAHPILSLSMDQSGGSPHVDVAFNPDFQLQFAVVDQNQTWSVWDIERGRKSETYKLSCLVHGQIPPPEDAKVSEEDGWARILWVGDVTTILVCNRRQLSIVDIRGSASDYFSYPPVISSRSSDWILDVRRHPLLKRRVFVLTSTVLVLIEVTTPSEVLDGATDEAGASVLLSWNHYRGAEDLTLKISVQMLAENESCVLVHSRLNSMVQTYIFNDNVTNPSTLVSSSNPTLLNLAIDAPGVTTQLHMEPLQFQHDTRSETQGPGRTYAAQETRFYKMFALQSELSVHEATMYAHGAMHSKIDPIGWSTVYRMRREVRSVNHIEELDDFLTTAGLQALDKPTSKLALQAPIWTQSLNTTRRTTDHSRLYDALTRKEGEIATTVDVPVVARELRHFLVNDGGASSLPLGTLMDIVGLDIEVSDIDEASAALQDLIATEDPDATTEVRSIASSKMMHLGESEGPVTIASLYDAILQHWVAPLPTNVPRRVRLQKERLARRIAADVILACLRMRQREEPEGALESLSQPALSQDSGVAFSRRNPGTPEAASQPLPSFSQLSLQSSQPQSSSQQSPLVYTPPVDPLARLRKHLNFRDDAVSPVISSSVRQVLAHWQLGTDPATYDWAATERALHNDNLDQASQEQMEKVRKKKERRERKQKQQDSLVQLRASSQPFVFPKPAVPYPRSSPGPALGGMASSSQVPLPQSAIGISSQPEFAPQSQVEPGKFGGRLDKKKKKRLGGF